MFVAIVAGAPVAAQSVIQFPHSLVISQAALQAPAQTPAQPGQPNGVPGDSGPHVELTLDQAVKLALDQNLDIAVQRLNPSTYDLSLASLNAVYRPTITSVL